MAQEAIKARAVSLFFEAARNTSTPAAGELASLIMGRGFQNGEISDIARPQLQSEGYRLTSHYARLRERHEQIPDGILSNHPDMVSARSLAGQIGVVKHHVSLLVLGFGGQAEPIGIGVHMPSLQRIEGIDQLYTDPNPEKSVEKAAKLVTVNAGVRQALPGVEVNLQAGNFNEMNLPVADVAYMGVTFHDQPQSVQKALLQKLGNTVKTLILAEVIMPEQVGANFGLGLTPERLAQLGERHPDVISRKTQEAELATFYFGWLQSLWKTGMIDEQAFTKYTGKITEAFRASLHLTPVDVDSEQFGTLRTYVDQLTSAGYGNVHFYPIEGEDHSGYIQLIVADTPKV